MIRVVLIPTYYGLDSSWLLDSQGLHHLKYIHYILCLTAFYRCSNRTEHTTPCHSVTIATRGRGKKIWLGRCLLLASYKDGVVSSSPLDFVEFLQSIYHCLPVWACPIPIPTCDMELGHMLSFLKLYNRWITSKFHTWPRPHDNLSALKSIVDCIKHCPNTQATSCTCRYDTKDQDQNSHLWLWPDLTWRHCICLASIIT